MERTAVAGSVAKHRNRRRERERWRRLAAFLKDSRKIGRNYLAVVPCSQRAQPSTLTPGASMPVGALRVPERCSIEPVSVELWRRIANWDERGRYQNMPVRNPGKMSRRDVFKLAARSLIVARHQESRDNFYMPRNERDRQRTFNEQLRLDLEWRVDIIERCMDRRLHLFHLRQPGGTPTVVRTTSMARTTRWLRMAGKGRMSTDFLTRQVILQLSLPVSRFF